MKRIEAGVLVGMLWLGMMGGAVAAPAADAVAEPSIAAVAEVDAAPVRSRQVTGTIVGVDRVAKTVTIKARSGEKTFTLSPRVQVKLGKTKATLADVQPGKRVFIRYRDIEGQATATTVKVL